MAVATVVNEGSYFAPTEITTTAAGKVNILNEATGQRLQTKDDVPAGTVFDSSTKTVRHGTTDLGGALAPGSEFFDLQTGSNRINNTGVSVSMKHATTWL